MLWVWIALTVVLVIIEAVTVQLVTIWFALGAVGGLIACAFGSPIWVQILIFAVISTIVLAATRPFVKRFTRAEKSPTNADRHIGQIAIVTEDIDNELGKGAARVGGLEWTARTVDGQKIEKDEKVKIEAIEGAKLLVKKG